MHPNKRPKLKDTTITSFFLTTTKDTVASEAFKTPSDHSNSSTSSLVFDFVKPVPPKNRVGRPLKIRKQATAGTRTSSNEVNLVLSAAEVAELALMGLEDEIEINNQKNYIIWSDPFKLLLKYHCHVYGKDGSHVGWNTSEYVIEKMKEVFPEVRSKTVRNKITLEKKGSMKTQVSTTIY